MLFLSGQFEIFIYSFCIWKFESSIILIASLYQTNQTFTINKGVNSMRGLNNCDRFVDYKCIILSYKTISS